MVERICEDICQVCGEHFLVDNENGSTYHETVKGLVPQRYCPECGQMLPLLKDNSHVLIENNQISNNVKRKIAVRFAKRYQFSYKVSCETALGIKTKNYDDFIYQFCYRMNKQFNVNYQLKDVEELCLF